MVLMHRFNELKNVTFETQNTNAPKLPASRWFR